MSCASHRAALVLAGALLACSALSLAACSTAEDASSPPPLAGEGTAAPVDELTPELAGLGDATRVPFRHWRAPAGCVLDPAGHAATCDVSGCSVPNQVSWISSNDALLGLLECSAESATPVSGVDFGKERVVFVRQGMRTGEWMRPEPVAWVVEQGNALIIAERREAFCLGGADINGGVVSYAIVLPVETASKAIDRRAYRSARGCGSCSGDSDCGS